ncbi:MAG: alpha/beta fold hydrolase [Acidobacteria bacterium]|nr:alpha/beta fold hydrolase [Acidobacteriota bacterium]
MSATELPLFFGYGTNELFGVLHSPAAASRLAVVLCHPFGEEKLWAHRVYVSLARELARRGHPVLRFDYRGNGDSGGTFSGTSMTSNLDDIDTAIDLLKERTETDAVGLFGLRFGATEAALAAERRADVSTVVLWQPVVDGTRYMQELLRINLSTQLAVFGAVTKDREALVATMHEGRTVNVDGYDMALPFYTEACAVNLAAQPSTFGGRTLIVQLDRGATPTPARELVALRDRYPQAQLEIVQCEPFWKEIPTFYDAATSASAATFTWLGDE